MNSSDTICAVSTPIGEGGIGIIRMSGSRAIEIALAVFRNHTSDGPSPRSGRSMEYGHVVDPASGETVDEALLSVMRAPSTYTREDVDRDPLSRRHDAALANPGAVHLGRCETGRTGRIHEAGVFERQDRPCPGRGCYGHHHSQDRSLAPGCERTIARRPVSGEIAALRDRLLSLLAAVEAGIDFPEEDIETGTGQPLAEEATACSLALTHCFRVTPMEGYSATGSRPLSWASRTSASPRS